MRRLVRTIFALCAVGSLLLCHAACVLWARSYSASDSLVRSGPGGWQSVRTARGSVEVRRFSADWSNQPASSFGLRYTRDESRPPFNYFILLGPEDDDIGFGWERGGFAWHGIRNERLGYLRGRAVAPFWSVVTVTAVPPLAWAAAWRRSRARRRRETLSL
jgi:hypothetical protein